MRTSFFILLIVFNTLTVFSQQLTVQSPNQKVIVSLVGEQRTGAWYLTASYNNNGKKVEAIPRIDLGLLRSDQDFSKALKFLKAGKPVLVNEQYTALHGKRSVCTNAANEVVLLTMRWMEKWNTANEGVYTAMASDKVLAQDWCYPALFNTPDKACWFLLHEADVNRTYCGSKLSNAADPSKYKIAFPNPKDGNGLGESLPAITLPWKSPWRVIMMGTLADIVASTLVDDVSPPSVVKNTSWIKPGLVSWNYWSSNHGTKDYKIVCAFADLAAQMNWPYTLLDWEWDAMSNGGNLEDALKYIHSKGVKPLIWYNSGGPHTGVRATPRDRMLTHQNRVEEFTKLKKMGIAGVKVDFFESEKQQMIQYYLDILEDAAQFEMMVYFHGCLVPRGWGRTWPHLMTYEGVRGAEWYNNVPDFTFVAPEHNTILPFTRNVVGAMDYTPVTFTNSQHPHITSYGHELALSVLFESGLQHLADRPEGFYELPDAAKTFLQHVPNAWDDIKLLDGYPGKDVTIARRKGNAWFIGGINGEIREKRKSIKFDFLPPGAQYKLTLIADGKHDKELATQYMMVNSSDSVEVKMLRRGGFAASLMPVQ